MSYAIQLGAALRLVTHCADPFCGRAIQLGERCIVKDGKEYCDERCYADATGAKVVRCGTNELTL